MLVMGTFIMTYTTSPMALTDGLEKLLGPSGVLQQLPPSKAQAVRKGQEVVTCDFCGRLVY